MKYKIILISLSALLATNISAQKKLKLENRTDSVSYAIGVSMQEGADQFDHDLNYKILVRGIMDASEDKSAMEASFAKEYIGMVAEMKLELLKEENIKNSKEFLAENRLKEGVIETASGLQYIVNKKGNGSVPTLSDRVKVHYTGYLIDGTKFDSSIDRGEPAVFGVTQVISGWTEILQLMPVGSEYKVFIPAELAYGDRQMGEDILPGSTLIFDIQLLEIVSQ